MYVTFSLKKVPYLEPYLIGKLCNVHDGCEYIVKLDSKCHEVNKISFDLKDHNMYKI